MKPQRTPSIPKAEAVDKMIKFSETMHSQPSEKPKTSSTFPQTAPPQKFWFRDPDSGSSLSSSTDSIERILNNSQDPPQNRFPQVQLLLRSQNQQPESNRPSWLRRLLHGLLRPLRLARERLRH